MEVKEDGEAGTGGGSEGVRLLVFGVNPVSRYLQEVSHI